MSPLDLDAIEARAAAATLGPWIAYRPAEYRHDYRIATTAPEMNRNREWYVGRLTRSHENEAHPSLHDAEFIAAARSDVPALVALARAQAAEIATLRAADDPLLDGTDGAHPAWWRGHDRAAEMLTAQRDAALADAARAHAAYATDLDGLRAELRRADDERAAWRDRVEARDEVAERRTAELSTATGEIARLRAALAEACGIIEGRTSPPTEAEIAAHTAAGGAWLFGGGYYSLSLVGEALSIYDQPNNEVLCHGNAREWLADRARWPDPWIPLDAIGRPCAWPVVEVSHG